MVDARPIGDGLFGLSVVPGMVLSALSDLRSPDVVRRSGLTARSERSSMLVLSAM